MAQANKLKTECVTPIGRVSYPSVFEPKLQMNKIDKKFELTLLFDKKETDLTELKQMLRNAATNAWGADPKKWPKFTHPAIKDGDEKSDQEAYRGMWYITPKANENRRPQVLAGNKSPITESDGTFYAGCFARCVVNAYAYGVKEGNKGVTFGLNAVQKTGEGERFDGRRDASALLDEIEDESNNPDNYAASDDSDDLGF